MELSFSAIPLPTRPTDGAGSEKSLTHDFLISFARKTMMGEGKRRRGSGKIECEGAAVGKPNLVTLVFFPHLP